KAYKAQHVQNTARGTTVPAAILEVFNQFELLTGTIDLQSTLNGLQTATVSWQGGGQSLASALQSYVSQILVEIANADTLLAAKTAINALDMLIAQMRATSKFVKV